MNLSAKTFYALKMKKSFSFPCISDDKKLLEKRIEAYFLSWKIMQRKGSAPTMPDFMKDKERVKLTIEKIDS